MNIIINPVLSNHLRFWPPTRLFFVINVSEFQREVCPFCGRMGSWRVKGPIPISTPLSPTGPCHRREVNVRVDGQTSTSQGREGVEESH